MAFILESLLVITVTAICFYKFFLQKLEVENIAGKTVLITGCDTGFGYDLAIRCLTRGMTVFASCLTEKGVEMLRSQNALLKGELHAFIMDVTSEESVIEGRRFVSKTLEATRKELFALVNNAGIVGNASYDDFLLVEDFKNVAEVNTFGTIRVIHAFKDLLKHSRGRIIAVISSCCRAHIPGTGPYTVSKYALSGYLEVLRQELRIYKVDVCIVEPGFFRTPLIDSARITQMMQCVWNRGSEKIKDEYGEKFLKLMTDRAINLLVTSSSTHTEWVVDAYYHAVCAKYPKRRYCVGYDSLLLFVPFSHLPAMLQDVIIQLIMVLTGAPLPAAIEKVRKNESSQQLWAVFHKVRTIIRKMASA